MQNVLQYWIAGPCITIVEINQPRTSTDVAGGVLNNLLIFQWADPKGREPAPAVYRVNPFGYASPGEPLLARLEFNPNNPWRKPLYERIYIYIYTSLGCIPGPSETEGNRAYRLKKKLESSSRVSHAWCTYEAAIKRGPTCIQPSIYLARGREMLPQRDQQKLFALPEFAVWHYDIM